MPLLEGTAPCAAVVKEVDEGQKTQGRTLGAGPGKPKNKPITNQKPIETKQRPYFGHLKTMFGHLKTKIQQQKMGHLKNIKQSMPLVRHLR